MPFQSRQRPRTSADLPDRVPPGQYVTEKWPVLHYGDVPRIAHDHWDFRIFGEVEAPRRWSLKEIQALPQTRISADIHCVTRWSRLGMVWEGVPVAQLLDAAQPRAAARYALVHAEAGWTTNLTLDDLRHEGVLLALKADGDPLSPEHGGPARLFVPHLYFWKSAKWVRGIELLTEERAGFWEQAGYHMRGNPWQEERYG